nr:hypothetical protein CFP56_59154 [Quercus suber]
MTSSSSVTMPTSFMTGSIVRKRFYNEVKVKESEDGVGSREKSRCEDGTTSKHSRAPRSYGKQIQDLLHHGTHLWRRVVLEKKWRESISKNSSPPLVLPKPWSLPPRSQAKELALRQRR